LPGGREQGQKLHLHSAKVVCSSLTLIRPPHPFVVVLQGWPSCLITLLSFRLSITAAFFPCKWHWYFKPKHNVKPWLPLDAFTTTILEGKAILIVMGDSSFLEATLDLGFTLPGNYRDYRSNSRHSRVSGPLWSKPR
jgi:hypothetical protein